MGIAELRNGTICTCDEKAAAGASRVRMCELSPQRIPQVTGPCAGRMKEGGCKALVCLRQHCHLSENEDCSSAIPAHIEQDWLHRKEFFATEVILCVWQKDKLEA